MKILLTLFLCLCLETLSMANVVISTDTTKTDSVAVKQKHGKFKVELNYSSNNTYKGRKDSSNTPIVSPFFKYTTKSNFFIQASLVNVPGGKKVFDEMDLGFGKKIIFSENWKSVISYSHYFFDSNVARIKAALQNDLSASLTYDWDILYSQVVADWSEGSNKFKSNGKKAAQRRSDLTFTFANSHQFWFDDVFKTTTDIVLMPEVDILWGTQNFLATYSGKTDNAHKAYQQQASKLGVTGYIFTFDIMYVVKNFTFDLAPYYTIPENLPSGESNTPYFVMSASIYYTFIGKK